MTLAILFWVLYIVGFLFGGWRAYSLPEAERRAAWPSALVFILIGLLGWAEFGGPVK